MSVLALGPHPRTQTAAGSELKQCQQDLQASSTPSGVFRVIRSVEGASVFGVGT